MCIKLITYLLPLPGNTRGVMMLQMKELRNRVRDCSCRFCSCSCGETRFSQMRRAPPYDDCVYNDALFLDKDERGEPYWVRKSDGWRPATDPCPNDVGDRPRERERQEVPRQQPRRQRRRQRPTRAETPPQTLNVRRCAYHGERQVQGARRQSSPARYGQEPRVSERDAESEGEAWDDPELLIPNGYDPPPPYSPPRHG
ncbi:hypothetical protein ISF_08407 [Cordyceps fumosorosea ARSEF 2679]|uniref:Uncharacterized protein n=1 Tax=Cordyceps fumosorosea (strain ARSEF 2679) TaxID=1081104 RepID=A0A162MCE5_CORFA|nr:hypothetical protein ISF_08407 [Cordyceps fumosorosea ARSEF 2679]OAA54180.1 hypothetical protein ISF_08407 [Cordyceps fumosorosea ARSEF 2679]